MITIYKTPAFTIYTIPAFTMYRTHIGMATAGLYCKPLAINGLRRQAPINQLSTKDLRLYPNKKPPK